MFFHRFEVATFLILKIIITTTTLMSENQEEVTANTGIPEEVTANTGIPEEVTANTGIPEEVTNQYNSTCNEKFCTTPVCIHAASNIINNMDMSINPCDDFYQFACKKYIENTRIPDDKSDVTVFSVMNDKLLEQVHDLLNSPITDHDLRPFRLAKDLYKACLNKSLIEQIGGTYAKMLFRKMGGWPVLEGDNWNEKNFDWKENVYASERIGFNGNHFFDLSVQYNFKNTSAHVLYIDQPNFGLDRGYLVKGINNELVTEYYKFMVDIAVLFGAGRERAKEELKQSLEFEIALANISLPPEERRNYNKLYNPMTISKLQLTYPSIPWLTFIREWLPDESIELNEVVIVFSPKFIKNLEMMLNNTSNRVLANYALGRVAKVAVHYLSEAFYKRKSEFHKHFSGRTAEQPTWKKCVNIADNELSLAVAAMYVRKYFDEDSKKHALAMVNKIRSQVYKMLKDVEWMDDKTRDAALEKAHAMMNHIGYPDELLDDTKLESFYEQVEIDPLNYFGAVLNTSRFVRRYNLQMLRKPVNKTDWVTHTLVTEVNARYDKVENSLLFSAGILQGTFFNKDFPRYLNYGGIGMFIGHEITHGFDDQGRLFDKDGNLVDWWQDETKRQYLDKAACIVQQYGNYTIKEANVTLNGVNTQGENIADNGGLKQAYQAYISWVLENGHEQLLPGLQMFSPQQMFWISAANTWCSVSRPESLRNTVITDPHAPGEFRVNGPVSNQKEFSRDFKCPIGSKMNPINKCSVW